MYFFFYFPLGAESPVHRPPVLSWGLAILLLGMHLFVHFTPTGGEWFPLLVLHSNAPTLGQAFTACFVHADLVHLVGNLLYLVTFGPILEERVARPILLVSYLLTGLASMVIQVEVGRILGLGTGNYLLGASGAIAGLLGLSLARCWFARIRVAHATFAYLRATTTGGVVGLPAWVAVAAWGIFQVVYAAVSLETGKGGTAHWAHLSGLVIGALLGALGGLAREGAREKRIEAARRYMREGAWYAAIGELQSYRAQGGDSVESMFDEARCHRLSGHLDKATDAYERGLSRLLEEERWEEAATVIEERERTSAGGGATVNQLMSLAEWMVEARDPIRAATFYEWAGSRAPTTSMAVSALDQSAQIAQHVLGDLERAADLLETAAERVERDAAGRTPQSLDLRGRALGCRRVIRNRMRFVDRRPA